MTDHPENEGQDKHSAKIIARSLAEGHDPATDRALTKLAKESFGSFVPVYRMIGFSEASAVRLVSLGLAEFGTVEDIGAQEGIRLTKLGRDVIEARSAARGVRPKLKTLGPQVENLPPRR